MLNKGCWRYLKLLKEIHNTYVAGYWDKGDYWFWTDYLIGIGAVQDQKEYLDLRCHGHIDGGFCVFCESLTAEMDTVENTAKRGSDFIEFFENISYV